jgi:small subunit ribosomal protein S13
MRVHQLGDEELVKLRDEIEANFKIEGDLRREVQAGHSAARSRSAATRVAGTARASPSAVQRTKTNARTRKGPKRTVAGKKKAK